MESNYNKFVNKYYNGVDPIQEGFRTVDNRLNVGHRRAELQQAIAANNRNSPYSMTAQQFERTKLPIMDGHATIPFAMDRNLNATNVKYSLYPGGDNPFSHTAFITFRDGPYIKAGPRAEVMLNPFDDMRISFTKGRAWNRLHDMAAHEYAHRQVLTPNTVNPEWINLETASWINPYFKNYSSAELMARGTQIKNWLEREGLWHEGQPITGDLLRRSAQYPYKVMDNEMSTFFDKINDYNAASEWITRFSP